MSHSRAELAKLMYHLALQGRVQAELRLVNREHRTLAAAARQFTE